MQVLPGQSPPLVELIPKRYAALHKTECRQRPEGSAMSCVLELGTEHAALHIPVLPF